jgi:serine/threonine-protein kinase
MNVLELPPGSLVGSYAIVRVLGRGGMGVVYEARAKGVARSVAIKFLVTNADPDFLARFEREGRLAARVSHPHVARVASAGQFGGAPYLVLELLRGGSLSDRLKKEGRLSWREVASLGAQVARGLEAIHAVGLVHRDLKPANVLLDADGRARVSDFGLARTVGRQSIALTKTGEMVGTYEYMAPEQAEGGSAVDARADLYALGGTLFALLTGRPPFEGSGIALVAKHVREVPESVRALVPDVPERLDRLILKLLSKRPEERGTDAEAATELDAIAAGVPSGGRSSVGVLGAGAAFAAAVAAALFFALGRSTPAPSGPTPTPTVAATPRSLTPSSPSPSPSIAPTPPRATLLEDSDVTTPPVLAGRADDLAKLRLSSGLLWKPPLFDLCPEVGHRDQATGAVFLGKEDQFILSGGFDGRLIVWDIASGEPVSFARAREGERIWQVAAMPSGTGALSATYEGSFESWRIDEKGRLSRERLLEGGSAGAVEAIVFLDEDRFFAGGTGGLWAGSIKEGKLQRRVTDEPVVTLAAEPRRGLLVGHYDGRDARVVVWSPDGPRGPTLYETRAKIMSIALSPRDTPTYVVCENVPEGDPRARRIFEGTLEEKTAREVPSWGVSEFVPRLVVFAPDGASKFVAGEGGGIRRITDGPGEEFRGGEQPTSLTYSLARSRDGRRLVTAAGDGAVRVWDTGGERRERLLAACSRVVGVACASDEGHDVLGVGWSAARTKADHYARVDLGRGDASPRETTWRAHDEPTTGFTISPLLREKRTGRERTRIATSHFDSLARIFDFPSEEGLDDPEFELKGVKSSNAWSQSAAFLDDGSLVAGTTDGRLRFYDFLEVTKEKLEPTDETERRGSLRRTIVQVAAGHDACVTLEEDAVITFWRVRGRALEQGPSRQVDGASVIALAEPPKLSEHKDGTESVVAGLANGEVRLLHRETSSSEQTEELFATGQPRGSIAAIVCRGELIVTASHADGTVRLWSRTRNAELARLDLRDADDRPTAIAFHPTRDAIFVGTERGAVLELELALPKK